VTRVPGFQCRVPTGVQRAVSAASPWTDALRRLRRNRVAMLGLALLRKYEMPGYLEETLLHNHFSFLHRSLSPLAVIDLADLVVKKSFAKHGKLIVESPLPDATIESTLGSSILDQFSSIGYRKYVEVRQPPDKGRS